jgi:hypothetical protein
MMGHSSSMEKADVKASMVGRMVAVGPTWELRASRVLSPWPVT